MKGFGSRPTILYRFENGVYHRNGNCNTDNGDELAKIAVGECQFSDICIFGDEHPAASYDFGVKFMRHQRFDPTWVI